MKYLIPALLLVLGISIGYYLMPEKVYPQITATVLPTEHSLEKAEDAITNLLDTCESIAISGFLAGKKGSIKLACNTGTQFIITLPEIKIETL